MSPESLPHISKSTEESLSRLLSRDYKLLQVSTQKRLGYQLMDLSLLALDTVERIKGIMTDPTVLNAYIQRAKEVGLEPVAESSSRIHFQWSSEIYPSQKALAVGQIMGQLNKKIGNKTLLHTLISHDLPSSLPIYNHLENTHLGAEMIDQIAACHALYHPIVDYAALSEMINSHQIDTATLCNEMASVRSVVDEVLMVLRHVERLSMDSSELRRVNHTSANSTIQELYKSYHDLDHVLKSLTQVNATQMRRPLNAAMLITYLSSQVLDWKHKSHLLTSDQVLMWLEAIKDLPRDIADTLWVLAKYKVEQPWSAVVIRQKVARNLTGITFTSSRMKYDDCQHLLRVLVGNVEERIELIGDESLINPQEGTLTLVPTDLSQGVVNPLAYEVVSTTDDLPPLCDLYLGGKLNDTQLLSNSQLIARLLSDANPQLTIYLSKTQILLSTLAAKNQEVSDHLTQQGFEELRPSKLIEALTECLIDVNRKIYLLVVGSVLSIDDLSDWVYQTQLIEVLEGTGIVVVDVPIQINEDATSALTQSLSSLMSHHVEG